MTDVQVIEILRELWRYEHTEKYTEDQIRFACEYAINKIRSYHNLLRCYNTLAMEYADYAEKSKREIPLRDNY